VAGGWRVGVVSVAFWWRVGGVWVARGWLVCGLSAACRWRVGVVSVAFWWRVGGVSAACRWRGGWAACGWRVGGVCAACRRRVCGVSAACLHLLDELDHADALSLVEGDGAAQAVELSREPQRRQTFGVSAGEPSPGAVAERLPRTLRWVQRVQSDAADGLGKNQDYMDHSVLKGVNRGHVFTCCPGFETNVSRLERCNGGK